MVTDGDAMVTDIVDGDETLLWSSRVTSSLSTGRQCY
ncbi:hypothetical protein A2U01_0111303, partial [Trifolium medium]|nr:hypothetical protein [Trifolium medium]